MLRFDKVVAKSEVWAMSAVVDPGYRPQVGVLGRKNGSYGNGNEQILAARQNRRAVGKSQTDEQRRQAKIDQEAREILEGKDYLPVICDHPVNVAIIQTTQSYSRDYQEVIEKSLLHALPKGLIFVTHIHKSGDCNKYQAVIRGSRESPPQLLVPIEPWANKLVEDVVKIFSNYKKQGRTKPFSKTLTTWQVAATQTPGKVEVHTPTEDYPKNKEAFIVLMTKLHCKAGIQQYEGRYINPDALVIEGEFTPGPTEMHRRFRKCVTLVNGQHPSLMALTEALPYDGSIAATGTYQNGGLCMVNDSGGVYGETFAKRAFKGMSGGDALHDFGTKTLDDCKIRKIDLSVFGELLADIGRLSLVLANSREGTSELVIAKKLITEEVDDFANSLIKGKSRGRCRVLTFSAHQAHNYHLVSEQLYRRLDLAGAYEYAQKGLQYAPNHVGLQRVVAAVKAKQLTTEEAKKIAETIVNGKKGFWSGKTYDVVFPFNRTPNYSTLARECYRLKDLKSALKYSNKGLDIYYNQGKVATPYAAHLLRTRGNSLGDLGRFDEAFNDYRTGISILKKYPKLDYDTEELSRLYSSIASTLGSFAIKEKKDEIFREAVKKIDLAIQLKPNQYMKWCIKSRIFHSWWKATNNNQRLVASKNCFEKSRQLNNGISPNSVFEKELYSN